MKNALNNQVGMLGDVFLWFVANLKQGVIYFIKQACGNEIMPSVYALLGCKRTRWQQRFALQTGLLLRCKLHGMFWLLPLGLTP